MKNIYYFILIFSLFMNSCGENCEEVTVTYAFQPDFLPWINKFKPGNWWVYTNKDQSLRDSVYVEMHEDYFLRQCEGFEEQGMQIILRSEYLLPSEDGLLIRAEVSDDSTAIIDFQRKDRFSFGYIKHATATGIIEMDYSEYYDSYTVNDTIYKEVINLRVCLKNHLLNPVNNDLTIC